MARQRVDARPQFGDFGRVLFHKLQVVFELFFRPFLQPAWRVNGSRLCKSQLGGLVGCSPSLIAGRLLRSTLPTEIARGGMLILTICNSNQGSFLLTAVLRVSLVCMAIPPRYSRRDRCGAHRSTDRSQTIPPPILGTAEALGCID